MSHVTKTTDILKKKWRLHIVAFFLAHSFIFFRYGYSQLAFKGISCAAIDDLEIVTDF